jgi:D-glycero-alpha-D-manno-heptose-7-phosphate kinase
VCNIAIARYAVATARVSARAPESANPLVNAALRHAGRSDVVISLSSDFPVGAGLGGSSSALAAVHGALARLAGEDWNRPAIAEEGRAVEVNELGVAGGRQDHYAATHGGALGLTFGEGVRVRRLRLAPGTIAAFERRGLLLYTGESRVSGATITSVMDAYRDRDGTVRAALQRMKELAREMADTLEVGDLDALGAQLAEHWLCQRSLDPAIPTAQIDEVVMRAHAAGAVGWKAMGASGGGCVFVLATEDTVEAVRAAIQPLGEPVPFSVDTVGLADEP